MSASTAAGVLQLLGIGLTLLGVTTVWRLLTRTTTAVATAAAERRRGIAGWAVSRRAQARQRWAGLRAPEGTLWPEASLVEGVAAVQPATLSAERRPLNHNAVQALLDEQAQRLRQEIDTATRSGWTWIVLGLIAQAVGTALATFG